MLFAVGVLLLAACASAQDTLCAKARAQHAQLDPNINYGTLSASAQRRLRILEATVKRCSTVRGLCSVRLFILTLCLVVRWPQTRLPHALRPRALFPREPLQLALVPQLFPAVVEQDV
jgi:hypothetical protein